MARRIERAFDTMSLKEVKQTVQSDIGTKESAGNGGDISRLACGLLDKPRRATVDIDTVND